MHVEQGGRADEEELQHPVTDVRDGEGQVVADVGTARLLGVADKVRLLIPPHGLPSQAQDQNAEDEEDGQPDLADDAPVTHLVLEDQKEMGITKGPDKNAQKCNVLELGGNFSELPVET
uniref:Uncharacterized protein n=1 Tax=Salvator merianae TaxID=96440 RepID=A0A8D0C6P7_SALMN